MLCYGSEQTMDPQIIAQGEPPISWFLLLCLLALLCLALLIYGWVKMVRYRDPPPQPPRPGGFEVISKTSDEAEK